MVFFSIGPAIFSNWYPPDIQQVKSGIWLDTGVPIIRPDIRPAGYLVHP
jgi:hypothetical protein